MVQLVALSKVQRLSLQKMGDWVYWDKNKLERVEERES
jgi:hypothetical protein